MYARTLKLYKGIDNTVKFKILNQDQKPVNLAGMTLTLAVLDDVSGSLLFEVDATTTDTPYIPGIPAGPSNVPPEVPAVPAVTTGIAIVVIRDYDLLDLTNQRYTYNLKSTNTATGIEQVVYTDDNYDARGQIELHAGHYPKFRHSIDVLIPTLTAPVIYSSAVPTDIAGHDQSMSHTAQFYFDLFTGDVAIQATLDPVSSSTQTWATISTQTYVAQNTNTYVHWEGVYTAVRFMITPLDQTGNPYPIPVGSVTKILYRS